MGLDAVIFIFWMLSFKSAFSLSSFTFITAKSLQSCLTLCDPRDGSPPGSPIPGILQARTPEWVAISFSNAWKWKVKVKSLSRVWLLATPWTAAHQAPPSMGFSRQEYWSGVPLKRLILGVSTRNDICTALSNIRRSSLWRGKISWLTYFIQLPFASGKWTWW